MYNAHCRDIGIDAVISRYAVCCANILLGFKKNNTDFFVREIFWE